jgi:hypothetical protein
MQLRPLLVAVGVSVLLAAAAACEQQTTNPSGYPGAGYPGAGYPGNGPGGSSSGTQGSTQDSIRSGNSSNPMR